MRSFHQASCKRYVQMASVRDVGIEEWGLRLYSQDTTQSNRISAKSGIPSGARRSRAYLRDALTPGSGCML